VTETAQVSQPAPDPRAPQAAPALPALPVSPAPAPSGRLPARLRRAALLLAAVLVAAAALFWVTLPDVSSLKREFPKTTAFMERRRAELRREGGSAALDYRPVPLSRISPDLRRAVVVAEDARFYEHAGVDWTAVRAAAERDWQRRGLGAGGSTLTQQLAKNLYLSPSRTPWRKLREWAIARRLESTLTKTRILELYLNVVEFGARTYGAEAAARHYFGKSAAELSPREAATLAAVIASPRVYDPVRHRMRVERRANRILRGM
jgi:monofunctional biosynthetic peptidoglycan transglycosylase